MTEMTLVEAVTHALAYELNHDEMSLFLVKMWVKMAAYLELLKVYKSDLVPIAFLTLLLPNQ